MVGTRELSSAGVGGGDAARMGRIVARARRGFTLIEAALVTFIVGLSCAALLQLLAAGTVANVESAELTTAINLAKNVHEATLRMDYAEVVAKNNAEYCPPVDSRLTPVADLGAAWKQRVTVAYVDENNLSGPAGTGVTPTARVTVTVYHNNAPVYTTRWIAAYVP